MLLPKILLYGVLPLAVLSGAGLKCYSSGLDHGKAEIQSKWDADKEARNQAMDKLQADYRQKENEHAQDSQKAADALQSAGNTHANELAALRSDYARSLQLSASRTAIYQRQAAGGAAECSRLAGHTAELDRSLEEGRSLVRELRSALELRDQQLVQVGNQLLADRQLLADPAQ